MKTLILKDLRKNFRTALIGLLIFSLLLWQAYHASISALTNLLNGNSVETNDLQPLTAMSLQVEAMFFCGLFGTALGWLQIRDEAHRDLWAFLIHRPITRTKLFWGKTIAGLCIYFFAVGLPLAILIAVVRTPGHVAAPFEWAMVSHLAAVFLNGIAYYFAGTLIGLRQVRWYASHSLGLGTAIIASIAVFTSSDIMIWVFVAVTLCILAAAAWGAFQSGGLYEGEPTVGKLALIVAMTMAWGMILSLGMIILSLALPLSDHPFVYTTYQMNKYGNIFKVTIVNGETKEVVGLDGHSLLIPKDVASGGRVETRFDHRHDILSPVDNVARFFSLLRVADKTLWYLDRRGELIGYDGQTRKYAGSLTARGYGGTATLELFLTRPAYSFYNASLDRSPILLPTARAIYQVNFNNRTVKPVITVSEDDEIGGYADQEIGYVDNGPRVFFFTTRRKVCLLDEQGKVIFAVAYQPAYSEYPSVSNFALQSNKSSANSFALWFYPDMNRKSDWKMPIHVVWLGQDHTVIKSIDLPTLRQHPVWYSWKDKLRTALQSPMVQFTMDIHNPWNGLCLVPALISGAIVCWLARRYNFSTKATVGWMLFAFLVGIAGLFALLCVQEWPAREPCPSCKKLRTVDREFCEHCGEPFAPPEKNGTEIFAPLIKT